MAGIQGNQAMRVKRLNNRLVVECQHCLGTTRCHSAIPFYNLLNPGYHNKEVDHWLMCQRCGEGYHIIERRTDSDPPFDTSNLHHPVCVVCEARGFIIV